MGRKPLARKDFQANAENMRRTTAILSTLAMVVAGAVVAATPATAAPAPVTTPNLCQVPSDRFVEPTPWPGPNTMTGLRVGQHATFDRIVVDGTKPFGSFTVRYVPRLYGDGSGEPLPLQGSAFLEVRLNAFAHDENGHSTVPVPNRVVNYPSLLQARSFGDFEGLTQIGIGLRGKVDFVTSVLTTPNRLVIDVAHPGQHPWNCSTGAVKVFFQNLPNYQIGREPLVTPVWRRVATPAIAGGALHAMFRWPTPDEHNLGLRFVNSEAGTFDRLSIVNGVASLRLQWSCNSGGSTFTIANEIMPTLKQFSTVRWVKIYDPSGQTERPTGQTDSIPTCLEP